VSWQQMEAPIDSEVEGMFCPRKCDTYTKLALTQICQEGKLRVDLLAV
jgi:hypothetical protein